MPVNKFPILYNCGDADDYTYSCYFYPHHHYNCLKNIAIGGYCVLGIIGGLCTELEYSQGYEINTDSTGLQ